MRKSDLNRARDIDVGALMMRIAGDIPHAKFTRRTASSPEEHERWLKEGVIINAPSVDFAFQEAQRRWEENKAAAALFSPPTNASEAGSTTSGDGVALASPKVRSWLKFGTS